MDTMKMATSKREANQYNGLIYFVAGSLPVQNWFKYVISHSRIVDGHQGFSSYQTVEFDAYDEARRVYDALPSIPFAWEVPASPAPTPDPTRRYDLPYPAAVVDEVCDALDQTIGDLHGFVNGIPSHFPTDEEIVNATREYVRQSGLDLHPVMVRRILDAMQSAAEPSL